MKTGQVSVEFIMLIGIVFLLFVVFFAAIQQRTVDTAREKDLDLLNNYAKAIENEIKLATAVKDGYVRHFSVPPTILGQPVNASLEVSTNGVVLVVNYTSIMPGQQVVKFFPPIVITDRNILSGDNCISKELGYVYLNDDTNCAGRQCLCI